MLLEAGGGAGGKQGDSMHGSSAKEDRDNWLSWVPLVTGVCPTTRGSACAGRAQGTGLEFSKAKA